MAIQLAKRVTNIKASPTLEITAAAKAMKAEGVDVVNFCAGEPDFDTPDNIKEAAVNAIHNGYTKYTPVAGIEQLRETICAKLARDNGLDYDRTEILVSCGAKHTLYNISQAVFEKGDEVIIPRPYWVSYPDQVILAEASPVFAKTTEDNGFLLTPDIFKKCITGRTKALIINSPSNPAGSAYREEDIRAIAEIAVDKNILLISDEIYEKIVYDGFHHISAASLGDAVKKITILVNGVSKAYSMTGWRIGYAAADKKIIAAMSKVQSQSTSNPASISQYAAVKALDDSQEVVCRMVEEFRKRRDFTVEKLNSIEGVSCLMPKGAFYVFPNVSGVYNKNFNGIQIKGSVDLANYLLKEHNIAVVPGIAFGMDDYIRLSYATSMENIKKGLDKIEKAIAMQHIV